MEGGAFFIKMVALPMMDSIGKCNTGPLSWEARRETEEKRRGSFVAGLLGKGFSAKEAEEAFRRHWEAYEPY